MVERRAFSAPGKALLVGGYLVLEPEYKSYVVALSARMHAVVSTSEAIQKGNPSIQVRSSQFNNDCWTYQLQQTNGYSLSERDNKKNPFIEKVLLNVLNYFDPCISNLKDVNIEIFSDSEYHSQSESSLKRNSLKEFAFHTKSITEVPKTGLGSSAGLVTVLTTALASVLREELNPYSKADLETIHKLAQVAHCQAQGKVGSGFDVASATFGSIIYRRFMPELISNLPDMSVSNIQIYKEKLKHLVDETDWNFTADRIRLPDNLRLMMGDVNNGSETTKLVGKVKAWYREAYPSSSEIYENINSKNSAFIDCLNEINNLSKNKQIYDGMLTAINSGNDEAINSYTALKQIRQSVNGIRENFRLITKESGADVEPLVQTTLLDACMKLNGVLTGVIPGAGGFDAIALLTTDTTDLRSQTDGKHDFKDVSWLDLQQADIGVLEEIPSHYDNLRSD